MGRVNKKRTTTDNVRMCFHNRTIQEGSNSVRFYHIKQSCDLTCIKQNMGIDSNCLELTGKCHDLYRIRIEKNLWFIGKHGEQDCLLVSQRMFRRNTEKKVFCIDDL